MKKSIISLSSLVLLGACTGNHPAKNSNDISQSDNDKPNIIFLLTDDLRWDALGFMGNEHVITPHIDRLASQSVSFNNAYHVSPICLPSRTSIMTGKYLGMHGSGFDRPTNLVITDEEFSTSYPVLLKEAGYFNGFIGKFGFAVSQGSEKNENYREWYKEEFMPKHHFDIWYGFTAQGNYRADDDGSFNGYENRWNATHLNEFMGYQSNDFIQKASKEDKPFCLSVSFKAPHAPFDPEEHLKNLYKNDIPRMSNDAPLYFNNLPDVVQKKSRNAHWYFGTKNPPERHIHDYSTYQAFIKNYYALVTGVDVVIGQIRQKLNELGIADNTIIIFTSDNGYFCGSRQLMGKALLYDESAKTPMIVYDPRYMKNSNGRIENGLISVIDIAPTILDLAGIEKPGNLPGKSFLPIVYDKTDEIHDAVYGENNYNNLDPVISEVNNPEEYQSIRSKFVRTKKYKYIRYQECHPVIEELFKIDEDSLEFNNLINHPDYEDVVVEMRGKLNNFEAEYVKY
ncbi:MAG: sulfatase-like hydrolase/transferase [Bacteroidales bacterium]